MTPTPYTLAPEQWQRLTTARHAYTSTVSPHYDETLHEITHRATASGSIGKADIGALLLWKRLRADTPWAASLMALPDTEVRRTTAAAITAACDTSLTRSAAAQAGRAALTQLPGFRTGDALASAVLTAAAPNRMAIYDQRAHSALHTLSITLSHAPGRYTRYIEAIDQLLTTAPDPMHHWIPRDMDTALYWLNQPITTPNQPDQHPTQTDTT
jgi:hypothetical protein